MERLTQAAGNIEGEISLSDLLAMFRAHWPLVAGSLILSLACAGIYLAQTPRQYEAAVTIKLGSYPIASYSTPTIPATSFRLTLIESVPAALGRMRGVEFRSRVISSLGWNEEKRVGMFEASYRVVNPSSNDLRVTVRGISPEDAARAAAVSAETIFRIHRNLLEATVEGRNRELVKVDSDIADLEAFLRSLDDLAQKQSVPDSGLQAANWLRIVKNEKSQLRELQYRRLILRQMTSAEFNSPTTSIGPPTVSNQAVHPRQFRVWSFSALVGILLGVFVVTVVVIRRMKLDAASLSAGR
jgi:hypothetical protein